MNTNTLRVAFALLAISPQLMAQEIVWIPGETSVQNGDVVAYEGSCFQAQNSPGKWETPSPQSTWFWIPATCSGDTSAPTCPEGQVLDNGQCVDPPPTTDTTATPWVAGETNPSNGDIVLYQSQCYQAQNNPGAWETPSSASWFWTDISCPNDAPIICNDGTQVLPGAKCPTDSIAQIYVSPVGSDSNDGSVSAPLLTLKKAIANASPGSVIELMSGRYHTAQIVDKASGTPEKPITIQGNSATFDGTLSITTLWERHSGDIYKTQLDQDIWQLFIDNEVVMPARWPNAQWNDGSLWNMKTTWRHQAPDSVFGLMIDERPYQSISVKTAGNDYVALPQGVNEQSLAESGIDATGAIAIMNIGSWLNWAQVVDSHSVGSNQFSYSTDFSGSGTAMSKAANSMLATGDFWQNKNGKYEEGHYYLEGKLELLDSENEWFFDTQTKTVYLWAPNGADPNTLTVKGKVQTYGLTVRNSSHIVFKNIDFFATAYTVISSHDITFDDVNASHYAFSKRMLGELTRPDTIKFINNNPDIVETRNSIVNSHLAYTDGPALEMIKQQGNLLDNNLIHDIDYSNLGTGGEGSINMASQSRQIDFTNNTFHTAGNSEGVRVGAASLVSGNHIYNTSLLQHDGAAINVGVAEQAGTEIAHNWVHDSDKAGIRFDGVEGAAKTGQDGQVHHNVVWNTEFSIIKGDRQATFNNTMFDNRIVDLIIFNKESAGGLNHQSETLNNLIGTLQGRKSGTAEQLIIPGMVDGNIQTSAAMDRYLFGASWGDFRPKSELLIDTGSASSSLANIEYLGSAPDVGAYETGGEYWLPGHRSQVASNPVPFDHSVGVTTTTDLAFNIESGTVFTVWFGSSLESLAVMTLPNGHYEVTNLAPNSRYFWRVDTHEGGVTTQGTTWRFTTAE